MSPLCRDRLIVGLSPERLTVVRLGKGLNPRPVKYHEMRLEVDSATPWRPGLAALDELVRDAQWQTAGVGFVLSSHLVRYAVIPGDSSAQSAEERHALGSIVFRKAFGNLCQGWQITLSDTGNGLSTLGAAIPSGLVEELRAGTARHGRIHSIRPDLMETFNRIADSVNLDPAIVVLIEPGRVTVGQVADGAWTSVVSRLAPTDDAHAFARVLAEEAALRPFPEDAPVWIRDLTAGAAIPAELSAQVRTVPVRWPNHPAAVLLA